MPIIQVCSILAVWNLKNAETFVCVSKQRDRLTDADNINRRTLDRYCSESVAIYFHALDIHLY